MSVSGRLVALPEAQSLDAAVALAPVP